MALGACLDAWARQTFLGEDDERIERDAHVARVLVAQAVLKTLRG